MRWPWQHDDEPAPGTGMEEAVANLKDLPADGIDSGELPRATEESHER